jgi:hypothetical protein
VTTPTDQRHKVRVVGSNYTAFQYNGQSIAYLEVIRDTGQRALSNGGQGFEFIHPLGHRTPTDIATGRVLDGGMLTLSIRELWHQEVWEQLRGLTGAKTIVDIFERLAAQPNYVTCAKIITPPTGPRYGKVYHRCVVATIQDEEEVTIGQLSVAKGLTVAYTHTTRL